MVDQHPATQLIGVDAVAQTQAHHRRTGLARLLDQPAPEGQREDALAVAHDPFHGRAGPVWGVSAVQHCGHIVDRLSLENNAVQTARLVCVCGHLD